MEINSFGDLYKITTSKNLVEYLQNLGMLKSNFPCKNCRQTCFLQTDSNNTIINTTFYCPNCKNTFSVLDGSFFESAKMPVSNILHLMWMWACEINTESAAQSMGMKKNIVVEQFRSFRGVIRWKLSQNKKLLQLGGPGHVVQIDKILLIRLRTKNNEVKQKLVISMYDTTTKKGYVQQIYNKTPGEVPLIIQKILKPGSKVSWIGYKYRRTVGYARHIHGHKFPDFRFRRNYVGKYCSRLRRFLIQLCVEGSPFLNEYIEQFMWNSLYGPTAKNIMKNLTTQVGEKYIKNN